MEYTGPDSVPAMGAGVYSSGALDIDSSSFLTTQAITYGHDARTVGVSTALVGTHHKQHT